MLERVMIRHFVINLSWEINRRSHIVKEFQSKSLPFEFYEAVTPHTSQKVAKSLDIDISNTFCSAGEIACLLSHVSLWEKAIVENIDYIGVFEDDICLGKDSNRYLLNEKLLLDNNIQLLKLDKVGKWVSLKNKIVLSDSDRDIYEMTSRLVGGAGYIMSNYAAKLLLDKIKNIETLDAIDVFLFDVEKYPKDFATHYLHPSLVIQRHKLFNNGENIDSSLKGKRGNEIKSERTIKQRIMKEINRNLRPLIMTKTKFM